MQTPGWTPRARDYQRERNAAVVGRSTVQQHPLLSQISAAAKRAPLDSPTKGKSVKTTVMLDPLSSMLDPLSAMAAAQDSGVDDRDNSSALESKSNSESSQSANQQWEVKKQSMLKEYTISGTVSVGAHAYRGDVGHMGEDAQPKKLDKYHERLARLERKVVTEDIFELSQNEYLAHIDFLRQEIRAAWGRDERVNTLKLVIQCTKLLADTNVPQFYPSMFVRITEVLDMFSNMVYNRLKMKAEDALTGTSHRKVKLKEKFASADIPTEAKETCRNWFYKAACITELLPRVYVEIALLPCYRFLTDSEYPQILSRLSSIIRGLGDPLVNVYARLFLVLMGKKVDSNTQYIHASVQDYFFSFQHLQSTQMGMYLRRWQLTEGQYLHLHAPAIDWILKCVGRDATKETFQSVLQQYMEHCNHRTVLKHIIEAFDANLYSHGSLAMVALIKSSQEDGIDVVEVFKLLADKLVTSPPPEDQRLPLLNEVWKSVSKCDSLLKYMACASSWLEVVIRHYSGREVQILLGDLTSKLDDGADRIDDDVTRHLEGLVATLLSHSRDGSLNLLTSDNLLKILDVFKGPRRVEICKDIMAVFTKSAGSVNDAILIHTLFDLSRTLHDSIDSLSPEGEQRHVASLIGGFIDKIDFGRDLEQQLNVYVECRAAFCNLDAVKDKLIMCVADLAVKAFRFVKGRHTKKTGAFVKACLAYAHITIPSILDIFRRLELMLHCAQVGLLNQCLPQTDTFLKGAISLIPEVPTHEEVDGKRVSTEAKLLTVVRQLLSILVVAPGHPEAGPFYIVQGLLNGLPQYQWQPATGLQTEVYISIVCLLSTYAQRKFPYKIDKVESNDELYGGAPGYLAELRSLVDSVMQSILAQLAALAERAEPGAKLVQSRLVLELINVLAARMELDTATGAFLGQLVGLAARNKGSFTRADQRFFDNTMHFLRKTASGSAHGEAVLAAIRSVV